ncbi:MAG: hypothetical protein HY959_05675 [Ignavibacteriae bacterium]|nr:hypothetical protein [Ignavibacteriota bacterium]
MKKLIFLFSFIILFAGTQCSFAQLSATTMKDIMESVTDKVKTLEDVNDQEIVNITVDLLVGSGQKFVYRYLDNNFDYKVLAIGDRRINSLNVEIRKKSGENWIKVDRVSGQNAEIDVFPDSRAFYEFTISVDEFKEDNTAGHFAFLLYHYDPVKKK